MELVIGLIVLVGLGLAFYYNNQRKREIEKQLEPTPAPVVETKPVEAVNAIAEPARCGCGRSPTGFCVGLHKLTSEEWSTHADNPNRAVPAPEVKVEEKPARKTAGRKPKAQQVAAKKPAAKKRASKKVAVVTTAKRTKK